MAAMFAKMAMKSAAKSAVSAAKDVAKDVAKDAMNQAKVAAKARMNQAAKNAISFGTAKLNQAQARVANKMGAIAVGTQAGAPVMVGPRGGNFRLNNKGQRMPMLPVG